ncbi:hypothetical protein KJA15_00405 [Patescibacteria group bacterium]|nr:hypothetical protein [Patescibacteria group bacterium]
MTLLERLQKKLRSSTVVALKKRIWQRGRPLGLTSKEAIFILAAENNVGYSRELKKLSLKEQSKIASAIQVSQSEKKRRLYYKARSSVSRPIKTQFGIINEPLLPNSVKKDAVKMAGKAYLVLYIFENSIRNFINKVLEKEFGSDWWPTKMNTKKLSEIMTRVKERMKEEKRRAWHGKRGDHPIYYSDFGDLILILKSHNRIFNKYLKNQRRKTEWLLSKLDETIPSRRIIAHHNPLSDRDLSRVEGNLMDWTKQLKFIRDNKVL